MNAILLAVGAVLAFATCGTAQVSQTRCFNQLMGNLSGSPEWFQSVLLKRKHQIFKNEHQISGGTYQKRRVKKDKSPAVLPEALTPNSEKPTANMNMKILDLGKRGLSNLCNIPEWFPLVYYKTDVEIIKSKEYEDWFKKWYKGFIKRNSRSVCSETFGWRA